MRKNILIYFLLLAACTPQTSSTTPIASTLQPYQTMTPSATALQPDELVVSFETPLPTPTPFVYVVTSGDTLSQIAEKFNVSLDVLMAANPNVDPNSMSPGQKLNIPSNPKNPTGKFTPTPVPFPVQQIACYPTSDRGMWCFVLAHNDSNDFMENITA
ncbi:MAG: LysM peptidoglycan-binding domain-containing protein, partial [Chloroflexi bacterium]|nr:LysM peptidoglycan-binding domain-containing protein [Chloroflexota bacterium]